MATVNTTMTTAQTPLEVFAMSTATGIPTPALKGYITQEIMVDISSIPVSKYDAMRFNADALVASIRRLMKQDERGMMSLTITPSFTRGDESKGYKGQFDPNSRLIVDLLHPYHAYGQLVCMKIKLDQSKLYVEKDFIPEARKELEYMCLGAPAFNVTDPINTLFDQTSTTDKMKWNPRLPGPGSFVGIFSLETTRGSATQPEASNKDEYDGLLVVYCSTVYNQQANKISLANAPVGLTYQQYATDEYQTKLRMMNKRLAERLLYDCGTALGYGQRVQERYADDLSANVDPAAKTLNPIEDQSSRLAILSKLRKRPTLAIPDIYNEIDVAVVEYDNRYAEPVPIDVALFDGIVPVSTSVGGLVAFATSGSPNRGLYVYNNAHGMTRDYKMSHWDGGYYETKDWTLPTEYSSNSSFYTPRLLVEFPTKK
jgi:hypothetical protein